MHLDGASLDSELRRDLALRQAEGDQRDHLTLPFREDLWSVRGADPACELGSCPLARESRMTADVLLCERDREIAGRLVRAVEMDGTKHGDPREACDLSQASADGAAQQHRRVIVVWRLDATLEVADGLVIGDAGRLPDRRIKI